MMMYRRQILSTTRSSSWLLFFVVVLATTTTTTRINGFLSVAPISIMRATNNQMQQSCLYQSSTKDGEDGEDTPTVALLVEPQVLATGYSQAMELTTALEEAVDMALEALPPTLSGSTSSCKIDLAIVSVSSLYDGNSKQSDVVPTILKAASSYGQGIQHLIGGTNGGFVSSLANLNHADEVKALQAQLEALKIAKGGDANDNDESSDDDEETSTPTTPSVQACRPMEREGVPGVTVTLAILPDVNVQVSSMLLFLQNVDYAVDKFQTRSTALVLTCLFPFYLSLSLLLRVDLSCYGRRCNG
jgi:hypothetical protein